MVIHHLLFVNNYYLCKQMENPIRHEGIVETVDGEHIRVRIIQHSACSACKVASHCSASESKEKIVDVFHYRQRHLEVGDAVIVGTSGHSVGKALLLGFVLPLVLLLVVIGVLFTAGVNEGIPALAALVALIPYYIGLWTFRQRIADNIAFFIEDV